MNIIPQNLKNEAIKIINSCFSFLSHNLTFSISEFFNSFHSFFYPSFMLKMKEKFNSIIINSIKIAIPLIDKMFLSSNYRRLNFYKCNTHTRSFTTIFGDLEYERI